MPPKKPIEAKIVDVDEKLEPVESIVVGDKRQNLGKRLGIFASVLLLLFFVINGYIQSSQNGRLLKRAAEDRSDLVNSIAKLSRSNDAQRQEIKQLQEAIRIQNQELHEAGFKTVKIPGIDSNSDPESEQSQQPQSSSQTSPSSHRPSPKPTSRPPPSPTPKPTPKPTKTPKPIDKVTDTVCSLTGICLFNLPIFFKF